MDAKWKKRVIAMGIAAGLLIGARSCIGIEQKMSQKRPDYLKKELEKEIVEHKRADILEELIGFSYRTKKDFNSGYKAPEGFSNEPYDLWVETQKNEKGESVAYLVNHMTGNRYPVLENDVVKNGNEISEKISNSFQWLYETISEMFGS